MANPMGGPSRTPSQRSTSLADEHLLRDQPFAGTSLPEGILPEGCVHFLSGEPLLNMDSAPIFEFHSATQLHNTNVDYIKWEIQDLCWQCLRLSIRKRDFQLWLRVMPPQSPGFPYGKFVPMDFDSSWSEVLNANQIPYGQERIYLRAHHPEGIFD